MRDELRMQNGEETAACGDSIDPQRHQFIGCAQEHIEHAIGVRFQDAIRCGAAHYGVLYRKPPSRRTADIARQALEAGVEHHDANADAVHWLAAMDLAYHTVSPSVIRAGRGLSSIQHIHYRDLVFCAISYPLWCIVAQRSPKRCVAIQQYDLRRECHRISF